MPLYSIILPSLRPELLVQAVKSVLAASRGIDLEVVVVSPFEVAGARLRHVPEREPAGNCAAHAAGYAASRGDFIVGMADDHLAIPGWLDTLAEEITAGEARGFPFIGGLNRRNVPWVGTTYGLYYPYFMAMSRRSVEAVGEWFDPAFVAHFGDCDLAMRAWAMGGLCEFLPPPRLERNEGEDPNTEAPHKSAALERDFLTFMDRYHDRFGAGFARDREEINVSYSPNALSANTIREGLPPKAFERLWNERRRSRDASG